MAWYDEAVFYHIYPLGLTGAPKENAYGEPVHRLNTLIPWIEHLKRLGIDALYIGPLFESVGHGYETTDYRKLDSRLGTNKDLTDFVKKCHESGIRVILDGVFNHTGRDFFAFQDIREKREGSAYRDWYNIYFGGNNEYNDGFSYENWGGHNLLVKLNQKNPAVRDYICEVIRFWVKEFDIDGLRLDAADVLDFDFMRELRRTADDVKPDFWLMGEVIHGDYSRWANEHTLHSVTNYALHKGLYSGMNDHNFFEIAHTVRRTNDMLPSHVKLYNFVDNHDVERISTKLRNKSHFTPVHILLYTLPGIPSIYYGSEFGIEGKKERNSDASLRPFIDLKEHRDDYEKNPCTELISALGRIHSDYRSELAWGDYKELVLTNRQFAFGRGSLIVAVNNDDNKAFVNVPAEAGEYTGLLYGKRLRAEGERLNIELLPNDGEIYAPVGDALRSEDNVVHLTPKKREPAPKEEAEDKKQTPKEQAGEEKQAPKERSEEKKSVPGTNASKTALEEVDIPDLPYEQMTIEQLQAVILKKMAGNGNVTDQMRRDVEENIWHDSLVNWAKSFR
ncbi:MAG: alpha-amylase [Lachnospiraceae bacterium]|nr:alpha-amylase [Lachnospiraceae bacterium]